MSFSSDWNFLLSLLVGGLAGFNDLRKRYGEGTGEASRTRVGLSYLAVRGISPAIVFLGLYYSKIIDGSASRAILLGAGLEVALRAGFYTGKQEVGKQEAGKQEAASFRGPY